MNCEEQHNGRAYGCPGKVGTYRQCSAGCKLEIAYCDEHGGDERSQKEMVEHHAAVHGKEAA